MLFVLPDGGGGKLPDGGGRLPDGGGGGGPLCLPFGGGRAEPGKLRFGLQFFFANFTESSIF